MNTIDWVKENQGKSLLLAVIAYIVGGLLTLASPFIVFYVLYKLLVYWATGSL